MTLHNDLVFSGWRKSTRSGNGGGDCVEVAQGDTAVAVRDSKNPTGPVLVFRSESWIDFITATKQGAFDR